MTFEEFKNYCLSKKGVEETYPFKGEAVWMKVMGKMFALAFVQEFKMDGQMMPAFSFINLKCDPDYAQELRAEYSSIQPGYHMNKRHWNTLRLFHNDLSPTFIQELIDHSYNLVVKGLPRHKRALINA